jgi:hypothetical protein
MSSKRPPSPPSAAAALARGLQTLQLPAATAVPLQAYLDELVKWNAAYNLTAVRERDEMVTRHLLDSLAIFRWWRGWRRTLPPMLPSRLRRMRRCGCWTWVPVRACRESRWPSPVLSGG